MSSPVKRHHRAKHRRNNRNDRQKHPFRTDAGISHGADERQAFLQFFSLRGTGFLEHFVGQLFEFAQVQVFENRIYRFGADGSFETSAIFE